MLYVDIFSEPSNISGALGMLDYYQDKIDDFILLPNFFRIIPSLHWAALNFRCPIIGKDYPLYTRSSQRALNIKMKPMSIKWVSYQRLVLDRYKECIVIFEAVDHRISPVSSPELDHDALYKLTQEVFGDECNSI